MVFAQSQYFLFFSFENSGYQLGCTVAEVSACLKCLTKYHDRLDGTHCRLIDTLELPVSTTTYGLDEPIMKHSEYVKDEAGRIFLRYNEACLMAR